MLMRQAWTTDLVYGYGWKERGERFHALKTGRRAGRVNMIAAWCAQHLLAPFTVEGACNRVVFETWVETCLVPVLQPGQVVILDNATFHKGGCIQQLLHRKRGLNFSICRPIRPTSTKSST